MVPYAYRELHIERREIRLCTLLPGTFDEPVACNLNVVSLDDKPEYESLSYAWGAPILDKQLVVKEKANSVVQRPPGREPDNDATAGGQPAPDLILEVTTNLYTALRYLRKGDQKRMVRKFQCYDYLFRTVRTMKTIFDLLPSVAVRPLIFVKRQSIFTARYLASSSD